MMKIAITAVLTAIAGVVAYFLSPSYREEVAQRERDKIASEVATGNEPAANARIGRFRAIAPWVVLALLVGRLKAAGLAAGRDAATTLLRTLVQLVYAVMRAP